MSSATTDTAAIDARRTSREVLPARVADEPELTWRVLGTLNVFRVLIALFLLVLLFAGGNTPYFGDRYPTLFAATAAGYLVFSVVSGFSVRGRWLPASAQAGVQTVVDILAITIMMHASGGISSGLGGLIIIFVGAASLVLPAQYPAIFAAIATFAVLGEQAFTQLATDFNSNYPAAGVLGAVIFAMALTARVLGRRILASEALARQRGVDLKNLSELNEYIVQNLRESIVVIDAEDKIRLSNGSATQLLGAEHPVRGLPLGSVFAPLSDYVQRWRVDYDLSSHGEFDVITEGSNLRVTAHLAPLGEGDGRNGPVLIFLEDASLLKERVQQSKLASLGRLSASIAHEIRNPVGAMSHAAQLLAESEGMSSDDLRLTEIIQSHSGRVSHIIDNVLQLSRRESSRAERLNLRPWLDDFAREFTRTHELQEGEMRVVDCADSIEVRMDPSHLRQVLWNLCDNAVKYASEAGGISVELELGRLPGQGRPYLDVLDQGYGVDPSSADKMFEPFYTERSGGTGLGLYISRELCELNRATLLYLDRPGGGSIFRIVFADPDRWESR